MNKFFALQTAKSVTAAARTRSESNPTSENKAMLVSASDAEQIAKISWECSRPMPWGC